MVANIGKAYAVPLDPDDPEDILTILAYALGGSAAEAAGKFGMRVGGKLAGRRSKAVFQKEVLELCKSVAAKMGVKLLQRNIVKYTVPLASIVIGTGWNYVSTLTVGKIATKHFKHTPRRPAAGRTGKRPAERGIIGVRNRNGRRSFCRTSALLRA